MSIPKGILDNWFFNEDDVGALPQPRPKVGATVVGAEFALENTPSSWVFYAEYWKIRMGEGYWDDRETDPVDHNDGDWLKPVKLGAIAVGANGGYELAISDQTAGTWVGARFGGGLGLMLPTGHIDQWHPGAAYSDKSTNNCSPTQFAPTRATTDGCDPDTTLNVPAALPILDIDVALKLHVSEVAVFRLDAGFHDMFFFGLGAGGMF